jgi:hypothetical protein
MKKINPLTTSITIKIINYLVTEEKKTSTKKSQQRTYFWFL